MGLQKSQPAETWHKFPPSASASPLKHVDASPPARKAQAHEIHEQNWQRFEHFRTAMTRTGRYEEEAPHKASVGANRPHL
jgi:hypothetical protein